MSRSQACRWSIHPAQADDLEVHKVGLPHLVGPGGLVGKLRCRFHHDEGGAGDQIVRLE